MAEENVQEPTPLPNQVFVGGLTSDTAVEDLTAHLANLEVTPTSCTFFEDTQGRSKGCALAVYETEEGAAAAIEAVKGTSLKEKEIFARADRGPRKKRRGLINEDQSYIYVGNLPLEVSQEDLSALFSKYGTIESTNVNSKRRSEATVTWASVKFSSEEDAGAATDALNGVEFQGNPLTVEPLKRPPRKPKVPRAAREERPAAEPNPCILYVRNLAWSVTDEEFTQVFAAQGEVINAGIVRDKRANKSRGWGTVEFATAEQAAAAIDTLNGFTLNERDIEVQIRRGKKRREPRTRAPRAPKETNDDEPEAAPKARRKRKNRKRSEKAEPREDEEGEGEAEPKPTGRRRRPLRKKADEGDAPAPRKERKPRERKPREPEKIIVSNPECHLFVGNLSWEVKDDDLQTLFSKHGTVNNAKVTMNTRADRSRGWGTVEMSSGSEADAAREALHESEFMERPLLVRPDKRVNSE